MQETTAATRTNHNGVHTAEPVIVERTFDVPISKVWDAITQNDKLTCWYFELPEFRAEIGFEFHFSVVNGGKTYTHLCKVTSVILGKKISYTWRYENYPGSSEVTFELFPENNGTRLRLTHAGIESFPDTKDFFRSNFEEGWKHIIGVSLRDFLQSH
ncbi:MAG TPA: SRPBCC domain-containing protein [Candidatus Kapabacteria bacterium]|nr:SRPBCC domain-containing protein [Candidatus Kapabacteria bacterium]